MTSHPGPAGRLKFTSLDLWIMVGLLAMAFGLRFFSPIMPNFLTQSGSGPAITNCIHNTPINVRNQLGTLCGLAYPFQRNYARSGTPATPPQGQVFDEIYFATFAHDDLTGVSYFDPEPPLGKEFIAAGEWVYGGWRALTQGARGSWADLGYNTFGWRLSVCVFGSLCIPLMYLLALELWPRRRFALAAAVLACFDGMFFVQSRIGMIDIFPIFLIMLSYALYLAHRRAQTQRGALISLLCVGLSLSLAISAKWICLAALASIGLLLLVEPLARRHRLRLGEHVWGGEGAWDLPGGSAWGPYVGTAVVALAVLPVGIYIASWFPFFMRGQFHNLGDLWAYQVQTYLYHLNLKATHPYGSKWYTWPFLYRPVAYYYEYQSLGVDAGSGQPLVAGIVNLGNPLIWWAAIPALLSMPYLLLRRGSFAAGVIMIGFITQYLPFSRISRVLFLYHMFGGLIFSVLALALVLVRIGDMGPVRLEWSGAVRLLRTRWLVPAFLILAIAFFVYFYPVWTGLPISQGSYLDPFPAGKMWLRTWI
ncbi:MAG TPA: phospholipid carrier-dependent glycosyltransferase [Candidatus Nitrosotalea sp.]|nr:phospholipid carrier-dependent glycosyltransferase [Candidatus Nitrosotalea sp.]